MVVFCSCNLSFMLGLEADAATGQFFGSITGSCGTRLDGIRAIRTIQKITTHGSSQRNDFGSETLRSKVTANGGGFREIIGILVIFHQ